MKTNLYQKLLVHRLNQRNHTLCVGVGCNLMLSASRPYDLNVQVPKIQTGLNLLEKTDRENIGHIMCRKAHLREKSLFKF